MPTPLHNATLLNYGLTKEQQIKIRGALSPTILHLEDKLVFSKALKIEPNMKKRTHALWMNYSSELKCIQRTICSSQKHVHASYNYPNKELVFPSHLNVLTNSTDW